MAKDSKYYELIVALKPLLPDDVRKELHQEFVNMVTDNGGEMLDVDVWGKRYLAYKISGHNEGYYIIYTFTLGSSFIAEFRRQLELKQDVLRYMITEVEDVKSIGTRIKKKEIEI
jgi:small subunit ribosomal protein S6